MAQSDFWKNKRFFITGGAGFLGTFLTQRLTALGADVTVPRSNQFDLRDVLATERMYAESSPEIIFHLAATVGGIGANQASPGLFFYENMMMGMNIIEQARHYGKLEKLVFVGTTCSYPKITPVPFDETSLWDGFPEETNAPYGIAKKALMTMSSSYWEQYGLRTVNLLPANLYGPRDNFDLETSHVIPALIRKFVEGKANGDESVSLWGTGSASREFLFADDAAKGLILAAEKLNDPDPVNLGTGQEITISELATLISELVGYEGNLVWDTSRPDGQPRRVLSTERAEKQLGFRAPTELRAGLSATIDWYLSQ